MESTFHDKVLGALVGSAMGDAMGASTEMWERPHREAEYGYITELIAPEIDPSPEGLWKRGYPAGATSDDTHWKNLVGAYMIDDLSGEKTNKLNPKGFANHLLEFYRSSKEQVAGATGDDRVIAEMKVNWITEWAQVSEAYITGDIDRYNIALGRFYGGDLLCAGMLYSPMFGLAYPGKPEEAYEAGYKLALFDQGYAKDITALGTAMVAAAMLESATPDEVLNVFYDVDPYEFGNRRIFQRQSTQTLQSAKHIVEVASGSDNPELRAWELLDQQNQKVSPHAQEILLISLTAMIFSDFDFQKAIEFMVNYGRDNDTTAAFAGMILGAYHGFEALPEYKYTVMDVANELYGIDLEDLASSLTQTIQNK